MLCSCFSPLFFNVFVPCAGGGIDVLRRGWCVLYASGFTLCYRVSPYYYNLGSGAKKLSYSTVVVVDGFREYIYILYIMYITRSVCVNGSKRIWRAALVENSTPNKKNRNRLERVHTHQSIWTAGVSVVSHVAAGRTVNTDVRHVRYVRRFCLTMLVHVVTRSRRLP